MKKGTVILIALLVLGLILIPIVSACGGEEATATTAGQDTTTVPGGGGDVTSIANAAIAAVTKSDAIETPKTLKEGLLQAGSDTSFPPMEFSDEKGGYIGFDVDLCTAIAKKMGLQLDTVSTAWDGIIPALMGDRFDIIMSAMSITPERLEQINFTDPYLPGILAISTPIDAPIADAAGLAGKTVGVQVDTTGQFAVEEVEGVKEIKKYGTILEAFQDLAVGRVEAVVNDEPVNAYIIETNADYKAKFANTGGIVTDNSYGYAIKKENTDLMAAMNTALKELRADGVYAKILAKWGLTGN
ncbi:MAG: basic amino acid ABC transporter substrate-binding protein [bacterium]